MRALSPFHVVKFKKPTSDGLQPTSDGLPLRAMAFPVIKFKSCSQQNHPVSDFPLLPAERRATRQAPRIGRLWKPQSTVEQFEDKTWTNKNAFHDLTTKLGKDTSRSTWQLPPNEVTPSDKSTLFKNGTTE